MHISSIVLTVSVCVLMVYAESDTLTVYEDTYANCIDVNKDAKIPKRCGRVQHGSAFFTLNRYRTFDGVCNNLQRPGLGAINSVLRRMIPAQYADGIDLPRGHHRSDDYKHIPTPHQVSEAVFQPVTGQVKNDKKLSTIFMTFGQFLDHDLSIAPHESCNVTDCSKSKNLQYPCMPIKFDQHGPECFGFARSKPVCKKNRRKPRDQLNELTAFIDLSQVYGSTEKKAKSLRKHDGSGEMKIDADGLLPVDVEHSKSKDCKNPAQCHLVGDDRGEENIALFAMHTLWVRQHNKLAKGLKKLNKLWGEEQLFQTARKINGAIWQHIVYNEYLPNLYTPRRFSKIIGGEKKFRITRYRPRTDPRITNVFSAAAFRYGHSLVPDEFSRMGSDFKKAAEPINLQKAFFDSRPIYCKDDYCGIDSIMMGLCANKSNIIDNNIANSLKNKLFIFPGSHLHNDLMALNIQRGRDHGIPTYMEWRRFLKFAKKDKKGFSFDDLKYTPEKLRKAFHKIYKSVEDIDFFPAALTEHHLRDKIVGPTLSKIFERQFEALRFGDRFFYTHKNAFTRRQLKAITRISLSKILCNNLKGMVSMQRVAFNVFDPKDDRRVTCESIPDVDLRPWFDRRAQGPFHGHKF